MAEFLGRELLPEEVVHHINFQPWDDRIENLKLLSGKKEHGILHSKLDRDGISVEYRKAAQEVYQERQKTVMGGGAGTLNWKQAILDFCKLKDWSRERFAGEIGVAFGTVRQWTENKRQPGRMARNALRAVFEKHNFDLTKYEKGRDNMPSLEDLIAAVLAYEDAVALARKAPGESKEISYAVDLEHLIAAISKRKAMFDIAHELRGGK